MKNEERKLLNIKENIWKDFSKLEKEKVYKFSDQYIEFINKNKTEREITKSIENILLENDFENINDKSDLKPGDKVYFINRNKSIYAAIIGEEPIEKGLNIIGSHIDSPRLDLKPNPLYEDNELAMFKTHYYGGIKKYQWVNIPLSMHGIIIKSNGEKINIKIGEKDNEPIFTIADLLPHLSSKQNKKNLSNGIEGEDLNILVGSIPLKNEDIDNNIKLNILNILNKKYGIEEEDFTSAEIEFTPSFKARSLGFDEGLIAGYGQDDSSCAYTSLMAFVKLNKIKRTAIAIFADKEEIGSMGNTGMYSNTFEYFIDQITNNTNVELRDKIFNNSRMLSADVTGAYNPNFSDIYEKHNESYINKGVSILKYTGSASKGGASDANAEFVGFVRNLFKKNNIKYQVSEMGKIGIGGGGTISYILANRGIDVLDCGIPVLSMHSPYEITSKIDIYNTYKAYFSFYQSE